MTKQRWLMVGLFFVLMFVIGVGLLLRERYTTIEVRPPLVVGPHLVVSPQPSSPLPPPRLFRIYVPLMMSEWRQSKKCAGVSGRLDLKEFEILGVHCTYTYWPTSRIEQGVEIAGVVQYPSGITVTGDVPYFLGFNEPDLSRFGGGAPVTPQMAAEIWPAVIAANPNKLAVSPAPSHKHPEWLAEFYAAHVARWGYAPKLDVLAIHCYESATVCINVVRQVIGYAERWDVPQVWVTEFAFTDAWQGAYLPTSTWQIEARTFIGWMDAQPRITRYYWWAMSYDEDNPAEWWSYNWQTYLVDWHTGQLNERGRFYQAVR